MEVEKRIENEMKQCIEVAEEERFTGKDLLAIMIAQFQILLPIFLAAAAIFTLLLLFFTKVWFTK